MITIRRVDEDATDEVRAIERVCLAGREEEAEPVNLVDHDPDVWLAYDGDHAVAFGVLVWRGDDHDRDEWNGWHLRMSGTLPEYQGHGLQRRLIRARTAHARVHRAECVKTYTRPDNAESMRALIATGFKPYRPIDRYAGSDFVYWRKDLP